MKKKHLKALYLLTLVCLLACSVAYKLTMHTARAYSPYQASDVLGQPDFSSNTSSGPIALATADDLVFPMSTTEDQVHHRLFVADSENARVLIYLLDVNNNLISHTASFVLGQPDFTTNGGAVSQTKLNYPDGLAYDSIGDRLFVVDDGNGRVMVYDLSAGIANGMPAAQVLGQPNFSTSTPCCATNAAQNSMSGNLFGGAAYDPVRHLLYVSDSQNARVLVYDTTNGVSNHMNASFVIGQPNFTSSAPDYGAAGMVFPGGLAIDTIHHRLFVADYGGDRLMVYDTSQLHSGMDAQNVLGQPNFTDDAFGAPPATANNMYPLGLAYDDVHQKLFVADQGASRVVVYDVSSVSNGMNAIAVIGQPNLTAGAYADTCSPSQIQLCNPDGLSDYYDTSNNRLFISDSFNNRVMVYDFARITTANLPGGTLGASYNKQLLISGTQGTVIYNVPAGSLPSGLSLSNSGLISGTPAAAGIYNFSVTLSDNNGSSGTFTDTKAYTVVISGTPPGPTSNQPAAQTTSGTPPAADSGTAALNLDDFNQFLKSAGGGGGYTLQNLNVGQQIKFSQTSTGTTQNHTIIIDAIDATHSTVTITIHSNPIQITLAARQSKEVDTNGDGRNDLGVQLISVNGNKANIRFWKVSATSSAGLNASANQISGAAHRFWAIWLLLLPAAGITALILLIKLRKDKQLQPAKPSNIIKPN